MNMQVTKAVEEVADSLAEFKKKQDERIEQLETAFARKSVGGDIGTTESKKGPETKAMSEWLRGGPTDRKALSVTDDGQGVTVRSDWLTQIFTLIRESSPMRSVANIIGTDSNEVEVLVDRGEATSAWTTETATRTETAIDFMSRHLIKNHEHYAYPSVTQQMLEDSRFPVEAWVQGKVGARFGRQEADSFIVGDGVGKPKGIINYGTVKEADFTWGADPSAYQIGAVYTGASGAFAASNPDDALYDLVDSLKVDYLGNARFMMSRATRNLLRKLKDADGRSLLQMSLADGVPDRLLGYPITIAEDMPDPGADSISILFGNFREAYTVVDRLGVAVLRDPGYSKPGYVRYYVRKRVGGALTNPEAVKALVFGTEPA